MALTLEGFNGWVTVWFIDHDDGDFLISVISFEN